MAYYFIPRPPCEGQCCEEAQPDSIWEINHWYCVFTMVLFDDSVLLMDEDTDQFGEEEAGLQASCFFGIQKLHAPHSIVPWQLIVCLYFQGIVQPWPCCL